MELTTAYMIHTSEGIPQRYIMRTYDNDLVRRLVIFTCDDKWDTKSVGRYEDFEGNASIQHRMFRTNQRNKYGSRFELYHPLTSKL